MPRSERSSTATRGFLFADLRGYTAFVEREGAHRAAEMLDRYRALVRGAVAEFDGAEIRTEGDSFYVVFDRASAAIECGLAIVAAAEVAGTDRSTTFQVGIGIHAGETVETPEGLVGTAVNTAARICAQAGPNQVLVSGTVRALTEGVVSAAFVPVGRRRLKGLRDPIELWRAVGEAQPSGRIAVMPTPSLRVPLVLVGAAAVVAIVGVALQASASSMGDVFGEPSFSPSPAQGIASTQPSASPSAGASAASSRAADAYPNTHETELLALIPESEQDRCERALDSDRPVLDEVSISGVPAVVRTYRTPLSIWGGIHCRLGGIAAPDDVWYWRIGFRQEGAEWIAQHAGKVEAVSGTCGPDTAAVERWSFGDGSGSLLCYTTVTGDAIVDWTYDQTNLFGRAIRDDRDMAGLLEWWADEARFLPD